jgi:hypothetical protein
MLFQYDVARRGSMNSPAVIGRPSGRRWAMSLRTSPINSLSARSRILDEIDALIKKRAENWRISRMAVVDRNILRLAIYEFLYETETPKTVRHQRSTGDSSTVLYVRGHAVHQRHSDAIKRDLDTGQSASMGGST